MIFNEENTLYDILEISSGASSQEIREAYLKSKLTYQKDSLALYTLIPSEEREFLIKKIEEAYLILSDPEKRRNYDLNHSHFLATQLNPDNEYLAPMSQSTQADEDAILNPPPTLQGTTAQMDKSQGDQNALPLASPPNRKSPVQPLFSPSQNNYLNQTNKKTSKINEKSDIQELPNQMDPVLLEQIQTQTEWSGNFLKKIRSASQVSLEEMAGITKVTKNYLIAIEEENFSKLPAAVYVRGFITQIAKILKLPHERVTNAYMKRYLVDKKE